CPLECTGRTRPTSSKALVGSPRDAARHPTNRLHLRGIQFGDATAWAPIDRQLLFHVEPLAIATADQRVPSTRATTSPGAGSPAARCTTMTPSPATHGVASSIQRSGENTARALAAANPGSSRLPSRALH